VGGKEVDFVLEYGKRLIAVEVKLSTSPNYRDTEGIKSFLEEYCETSIGIIIHTGNEVKYLGQKILAMPWIMFTGMIQTVSLARYSSSTLSCQII